MKVERDYFCSESVGIVSDDFIIEIQKDWVIIAIKEKEVSESIMYYTPHKILEHIDNDDDIVERVVYRLMRIEKDGYAFWKHKISSEEVK